MKLLTYNLHKGRSPLRRDVLDRLAESLAELAPDVLFCQEVFHGTRDSRKQCDVLADALGHAHVFGPNVFYRRGCHGNATFARYPIRQHTNIDVSESLLERRGILHASLEVDSWTLETFNVHFSLTARQRRRQWHRLSEALPADSSPVIVAGDFNDWNIALDRRAREAGHLDNALWALRRSARRSFPASRPLLALDRVYLRGLRAAEARVLRGRPWNRLSDHLPVEVTLERDD